jgi:hypothetical protein
MSTTPEQLAVELEDLANICAQDRWLSVADYVDDLRAAAAMIRAAAARLDELERENARLRDVLERISQWKPKSAILESECELMQSIARAALQALAEGGGE